MSLEILNPQYYRHPIQGLLFDMDGLVLDSEKLYTRFWAEAAQAMGYPMTRQQALGMRSLNAAASQAYLESCFGPGISYQQMHDIRVRLMDAYIAQHGVDIKPGIRQLLDYLDEHRIPRAITSSSPQERILNHLSRHDLAHRFDRLCSGYQVRSGKPAPDIYLYGAAQLGLAPENCLALEDSPAGVLSAHRAGCLSVVIPDQDQPGPETTQLVYAKADSLSDIIDLLEQFAAEKPGTP